jgi:hypothetical protein
MDVPKGTPECAQRSIHPWRRHTRAAHWSDQHRWPHRPPDPAAAVPTNRPQWVIKWRRQAPEGKGSLRYSGQASGQLRVSGNKLSGVTRSSTFNVKSQINGVSFNLPLPKVTAGSTAPWVGYTCSGNTLTLIEPQSAGTWSLTRTS